MGNFGDPGGFWLVALVLAGGIAALLITSLVLARRNQGEPDLSQDIRLYREQLAGIDRDAARGMLKPAEAGRLRAEIGRRLLEADRASPGARKAKSGSDAASLALPGLLILAALGGALAIYARLGSPVAVDQPMDRRLALSEARMAARPSQADYILRLPPLLPAEPEPDMVAPLQKLRETVDPASSDNLQGLQLRATIEARLGNLPDAILAQSRLIALRDSIAGDRASHVNYSDLVLMLVEQAAGYVSPEAEAVVVKGLGLGSRSELDRIADLLLAASQGFAPQKGDEMAALNALPPVGTETGPLYLFAGELYSQGGRPDRAFALWRPLLENGPQEAFWVPQLRDQIRAAAWFAGAWEYQLPELPAGADLRGPDAAAVAAAADLDEAGRAEMIEGMIGGLRGRLLEEGGTGAEWAQLLRALVVLGRVGEAQEMLALGLKAHPAGEERAMIEAAAAGLAGDQP